MNKLYVYAQKHIERDTKSQSGFTKNDEFFSDPNISGLTALLVNCKPFVW
ncbi:MAG: hypothetical protein R6W68_15805 [Ignavibacteriaceae bacterium]